MSKVGQHRQGPTRGRKKKRRTTSHTFSCSHRRSRIAWPRAETPIFPQDPQGYPLWDSMTRSSGPAVQRQAADIDRHSKGDMRLEIPGEDGCLQRTRSEEEWQVTPKSLLWVAVGSPGNAGSTEAGKFENEKPAGRATAGHCLHPAGNSPRPQYPQNHPSSRSPGGAPQRKLGREIASQKTIIRVGSKKWRAA